MKKICFLVLCLIQCVALFATAPEMAISGKFSVSENKQVYFAKGNLQYHCKNKVWQLAENQLTIIGNENTNISDSYDGWIDLFGWSADNTTALWGISTSTDPSDYNGSFVDWGKNIGIGWRTLTLSELKYLINHRQKGRTNGDQKYGIAQVAGVDGIILLPDEFVLPSEASVFFSFNYGASQEDFAKQNSYTSEQWIVLENAGAVFLPVTGGIREGNKIDDSENDYWLADALDEDGMGSAFGISNTGLNLAPLDVYLGAAVRLVYDVPSEDTPTALQDVENVDIYTENGRIVCNSEFQIFDLLGCDVTRMNGQLNGIYVVKVGDKAQKVIVR